MLVLYSLYYLLSRAIDYKTEYREHRPKPLKYQQRMAKMPPRIYCIHGTHISYVKHYLIGISILATGKNRFVVGGPCRHSWGERGLSYGRVCAGPRSFIYRCGSKAEISSPEQHSPHRQRRRFQGGTSVRHGPYRQRQHTAGRGRLASLQ